jgi:MOSC domain-containing protein YiiM
MPREGLFAKVIAGGTIAKGAELRVESSLYKAAL